MSKVLQMERVKWDLKLAKHLISRCSMGNAVMGGRRNPKVESTWSGNAAKAPRVCNGGRCLTRENQKAGSKTRMSAVCWCNLYTRNKGSEKAVALYKTCNAKEVVHVTAVNVSDARKTYSGIDWLHRPWLDRPPS